MLEVLNKKVAKATKWAAMTEVAAKLVTPIINMVLARLLTPEAFGVVTTITMIITFAELFTDAGFQKYLIQHEFNDENDREESTNVAFWSNFAMSFLLWGGIAVCSDSLAELVGNPGLGHVVVVSCVSIPLAAFSSIQIALYKRDFDFKTLFKVRIVGICIPLFVTIPCALLFRNYWALIIGIISRDVSNAVLLTRYSKWKPQFFFSTSKLKEMVSFTSWSLVEAVSIWLTQYVDVFVVGTLLSQHYLGLYKTSTTIVGQMMGMITAATTPILFSSLSRLQDDDEDFRKLFLQFQKLVGMLVIPLGLGIFCFSDLITVIFLGEQWMEAAGFIGLWGITSSVAIIYSHYSSEVYRAKGLPKLSVLAQWLHIIVLWPVVLFSVSYGFEVLYTARAFVRLELILVNLFIIYHLIDISPVAMLKNTAHSLCAAFTMMLLASFLRMLGDSIVWQFMSIVLCILIYFAFILFFKEERELIVYRLLKKYEGIDCRGFLSSK